MSEIILENCRTVDFHFNKGSLGNPDIPMWVIKAKGTSHYVSHVNAEVPWSTRETPEGSTQGMLRFRNCNVSIVDGEARITKVMEL
jgi:hypothetical protein